MKRRMYSMNGEDLGFANTVANAVNGRVDELVKERDSLIDLIGRMLNHIQEDHEDEIAICEEARNVINGKEADNN